MEIRCLIVKAWVREGPTSSEKPTLSIAMMPAVEYQKVKGTAKK
jgi:hypothetical protein